MTKKYRISAVYRVLFSFEVSKTRQLNEKELAEQNIKQNTIRLSIGTEHIDDIIADLEGGFAAI